MNGQEPPNHTEVWMIIIDTASGAIVSRTHDTVFYGDYGDYQRMPEVCKSADTEAEHRAWWEWRRNIGPNLNGAIL